jgi:hypothetical protein
MIRVPAAVIPDRRPDWFGHFFKMRQQGRYIEFLKLWMVLKRRVKLIDICLMVPGMVNFHGHCIDMGFQGIIGIG